MREILWPMLHCFKDPSRLIEPMNFFLIAGAFVTVPCIRTQSKTTPGIVGAIRYNYAGRYQLSE